MLRVVPLSGDALRAVLPQLALLRIEIFRDWPYLYDGTLEYERSYVSKFIEAPDHLAVCAFDGDSLVGAATAVPLRHQHSEFTEPFTQAGIPVHDVFYFAESVLKNDYRGRGLGHAFFDGREKHAAQLGYSKTAFCGVMRPDNHPLKEPAYRPLDDFWHKRGYRPLEGVIAHFSWQDIDQPDETTKPLQFWGKGF